MTATVSPVPLLSPASMRFGVWRPACGSRPGVSAALLPQWRAEWLLARSLPVKPVVALFTWVLACAAALAVTLMQPDRADAWFRACALMACAMLGLGWLTLRRHARDSDHIGMQDGLVRVCRVRAGRQTTTDFHPRWVRIEPEQHDRSVIRLSGQGQAVAVGEFVSPGQRRQLADELRWALRHLDD